MNWTTILVAIGVVLVFIALKRSGQISVNDARTYLKNGAIVVDVRSPGEFNSGHLPIALNIPLDDIVTALPKRVADTNQVILLHCQSGMRSSLAQKKLKSLGYARAFNLGSYGRAESILKQSL